LLGGGQSDGVQVLRAHPIVQSSSVVMLNALAVSLSVVLLGMLLMISHRQAVACGGFYVD